MKNFLLLSVCMLLCALSVSGQKRSTDLLYAEPPPPAIVLGKPAPLPQFGNLVSRPSFKRIYRKDFSAVTGTNNLPVSQVAITLNKPAIQVGQFIPIYDDTNGESSVPVYGFYPYISGRLNDDDEFKIAKTSKIDPKIGFGGKIVIIPAGKGKGTGYFFDPTAPSTTLFMDKNNFLKPKVEEEYKKAQIQQAIIKLNGEIVQIEGEKQKNEFLSDYLKTPGNFNVDIQADKVVIDNNKGKNYSFDLLNIEKALTEKLDKVGRIEEIKELKPNGLTISNKSPLLNTLLITELISDLATLDKAQTALQEKLFEKQKKLLELQELSEKEQKDLDKLKDDKIYEAEKDAPYTLKRFFWFTLEGDSRNQSANLFRNNVIEEDKDFRKSSWGWSVNYAWFAKKWIWTLSAKREVTRGRQFFENDPISYIADSLLLGGKYKTATTTEAYDVSKLSNSDLIQSIDKVVWTAGGTILYGETKKYGFTTNYRLLKETKVANLKIGLIFPVILDNAKGEQSNIILELVMPDIHTKLPANLKKRLEDGDKVWERSYFNLKVGIPINLL